MTSLRNILSHLHSYAENGEKIPSLFVGHGSPMNSLEANSITQNWKDIGQNIVHPNAILCISAHWITRGQVCVHTSHKPRQIYDFYGFPEYLYDLEYHPHGSPQYARQLIQLVKKVSVQEDFDWGIDHGTWSVLCQMYPDADVPVFQISLDYDAPFSFHYALAKELQELRKKGVLIIGSGNLVHNLGMMQYGDSVYDWNIEFDSVITQQIEKRDIGAILQKKGVEDIFSLAHPTHDHFLPLLYFLGTIDAQDTIASFNEEFQLGSLSMRSFIAYK